MLAPAILETRDLSCNRNERLPFEYLDITMEPGQVLQAFLFLSISLTPWAKAAALRMSTS